MGQGLGKMHAQKLETPTGETEIPSSPFEDTQSVGDSGNENSAEDFVDELKEVGEREEQSAEGAEDEDQDIFEDFDIIPEEKEFIKELLPFAPEEEIVLLRRASIDSSTGSVTLGTGVEIPFKLSKEITKLEKKVQHFAHSHWFWILKIEEDEDISEEKAEFESDIIEFAMGIGMGEHVARVEVMRALGEWKVMRGFQGIDTPNMHESQNTIEEAVKAITAAKEVIHGADRKRKRSGLENTNYESGQNEETLSSDEDVENAAKKRKKMLAEIRRTLLAKAMEQYKPTHIPTLGLKPVETFYNAHSSRRVVEAPGPENILMMDFENTPSTDPIGDEAAEGSTRTLARKIKLTKKLNRQARLKARRQRKKKMKAEKDTVNQVLEFKSIPYEKVSKYFPLTEPKKKNKWQLKAEQENESRKRPKFKEAVKDIPDSLKVLSEHARKSVLKAKKKADRDALKNDREGELKRLAEIKDIKRERREEAMAAQLKKLAEKQVKGPKMRAPVAVRKAERKKRMRERRRNNNRLRKEHSSQPESSDGRKAESTPNVAASVRHEEKMGATSLQRLEKGEELNAKDEVRNSQITSSSSPKRALVEPLDANSKKSKGQRRDRGRKKSSAEKAGEPLVEDQDSTGGEKSLDLGVVNDTVEDEDLGSERVNPDSFQYLQDTSSYTSELAQEEPSLESEGSRSSTESDSEVSKSAPITPHHDFNIIIYTPAKEKFASQTSTNHETEEVSETPESDDNISIFSMTNYGSLDWDHSGDEFEKIKAIPKATRGSTTTSPDATSKFTFAQVAMQQDSDVHDSVVPAKESKSLRRDSMGRFAPNTPSPAQKCVLEPKSVKKRNRSPSSLRSIEKLPPTLVRDSNGRLALNKSSSTQLLVEDTEISISNTLVSPGIVSGEKSTQATVRNSDGKLSPKGASRVLSSTKGSKTPPSKKQRFSATKPSDSDLRTVIRDDNGKFPPKKETPIPPPRRLDFKALIAGSRQKDTFNASEVVADRTNELEKALVKAKAKRMRATAKSPYFSLPDSPKKNPKSKGRNGEGIETLRKENLQPLLLDASTKAEDGVCSSQGSTKKRSPGKTVSCIPFPPLSALHFGLIQEKLAHEPFRLLVAVTFLIRTHGKHALPVFYSLMEKYPTPESLVAADKEDILPIIHHLGLQNQRASTYQTYAKIWLEDPPSKGKRYPVRGYPSPNSAKDVKKGDILTDEDEREAWEIGHMTQGPYAIDSWRIFCRDKLRGVADGWNGEGAVEGFQPEWMRVLPEDKELRAYLRWMWLKEGFEWNPFTGEKEVAKQELVRAAMEGTVAWDDNGGMRILESGDNLNQLSSTM